MTHGETITPFQSLRRALGCFETPHGAIVTPVDVAPAPRAVWSSLCASAVSQVPVGEDGREGHPVRLCPMTCDLVRTSTEPVEGLRTVLRNAERTSVPCALPRDFDTREAWREERPAAHGALETAGEEGDG